MEACGWVKAPATHVHIVEHPPPPRFTFTGSDPEPMADIPPELLAILPSKKKGQQIGPKNPKFARGAQLLITVVDECQGVVGDAGKRLGLSTGQLSKVLTSDRALLAAVNQIRQRHGLRPLKAR